MMWTYSESTPLMAAGIHDETGRVIGTFQSTEDATIAAKAPELYDALLALTKHFGISKDEFDDPAWENPTKPCGRPPIHS